jgi:GDP-mannose 6-dehydrogenase
MAYGILDFVNSGADRAENWSVAILGLGYVGCVTAACLAHLGHRVTGVDRDPFKVESVRAGRAPFFEPGLEDLVADGVASGSLSATTDLAEALAAADVALICVGTPSEKNGNLGLEQLRRVAQEIGASLAGRTKPLIVAVRSTAFPGTCEEVVEAAMGGSPMVSVVCNPEFLREGEAVRDFMEPSLLVVGGESAEGVAGVAALYRSLAVEPVLTSLRTAELIKYACNAFHAVKIAFANEMGTLAGQLGIDGDAVMDILCRDHALNISATYLRPGFAFGGSCLPKDLRALAYRAARLDLKLPLLENVLASNQAHLERAISLAVGLPGEHIGVYGLAFKENTDDLRESPVVLLLETLIGKGRKVRVYDPRIHLGEIYGSNQRYIMNLIPHIGNLLHPELDEMLGWADHVLVAQKPSAEAMARLGASGKPLIDLVGALGQRSREAPAAARI